MVEGDLIALRPLLDDFLPAVDGVLDVHAEPAASMALPPRGSLPETSACIQAHMHTNLPGQAIYPLPLVDQ